MRATALRIALGVSAALACRGVSAGEESLQLLDGAGRDLTATACVSCHSLDYILMNAPIMSRAAWEKTIRKMIDKFGAPIRPEDVDEILTYLSTHYSG
jgi:sulfite dehydrogenase (cytochrome) subunit B